MQVVVADLTSDVIAVSTRLRMFNRGGFTRKSPVKLVISVAVSVSVSSFLQWYAYQDHLICSSTRCLNTR